MKYATDAKRVSQNCVHARCKSQRIPTLGTSSFYKLSGLTEKMKFSPNKLGHYTINSSAGSVGTAAAVCQCSHDVYSASCPGFQSCHQLVSCTHKLVSQGIQILYYNI
jgi:hypothetical protein